MEIKIIVNRENQTIEYIKSLFENHPITIWEITRSGIFNNLGDWNSKDKEIRKKHIIEDNRLFELFKESCRAYYKLENNPKFNILFEKAWDMGHYAGFTEVLNYFEDLIDLIKEDKIKIKDITNPSDYIFLIKKDRNSGKFPCVISEEKYKLKDGYKITLISLSPNDIYYKEHFYRSDLESLIKEGIFFIYKKVQL